MGKYERLKEERLGEERINKQGCLMKIVEYNKASDIVVEFQDEYKYKLNTSYGNFKKETIINPYHPTICGVGMKGSKYPASYMDENGNTIHTKGYDTFKSMITRCYNVKYHAMQPTYTNAECCKEWLNRDNFEDWLRGQPNYENFLKGDFALDKDIIVKNNKIYSPETCCLVPRYINELFKKDWNGNNGMPVGVRTKRDKYVVYCCVKGKNTYVGTYETKHKAFMVYKNFKEKHIKQVANEEFMRGNITKECYDAMMSYDVKFTG